MKLFYSSGSKWLTLVCFMLLSAYVVYKQATDLNAISIEDQIVRHQRMLDGESEFFNPWQYRILSTYLAEGFHQLLNNVSSRIDKPISFLLFRFLQNLLIFYIAKSYFQSLNIRNPWLILTGILIMTFSFAHSVFRSDLSFNTYFDILFYLLAALLIMRAQVVWLIPLMFFAALNRETSLLIPGMLIIQFITWKPFSVNYKIFGITVTSVVAFAIGFVGVRLYFGYSPPAGIHGMTTFLDFFVFNLKFKTMYPELIGTFAFLPLVVIIFLTRLPFVLQRWFWLVVPTWFFIHLAYSTAVETRLFLVPQVLIFIPAFLWLIENWYALPEAKTQNQA